MMLKAWMRRLLWFTALWYTEYEYSPGSSTNGYTGWVEVGGQLVAFRRENGGLQFNW